MSRAHKEEAVIVRFDTEDILKASVKEENGAQPT